MNETSDKRTSSGATTTTMTTATTDTDTDEQQQVALNFDRPLLDDDNDRTIAAIPAAEEDVIPWRDVIKQVVAACVIHSVVIQAGINLSFSAVLLPQLRNEEFSNGQKIDTNAASWIASLVTISLPLGSLIVGTLMDRYGRKRIAILSTLPFLISWSMHYFASTLYLIYVARILAGFASGLSTVCLIYVSELCHPRYRSMLLNLNSVFVCLGILITCLIGSYLHWRTMALCYAVLVASSASAILLLPESPHWLHRFAINRERDACNVLYWFYSHPDTLRAQKLRLFENGNNDEQMTMRRCVEPVIYKPFLILFVLFLLQQMSGCYVIIFYAVDVFERIGNGIDEYRALVYLGTIRFLLALVSTVTALKVGRKWLLCVSACVMLVAASVGAVTVNGTVTSACVLLYVAGASFGVMVVPWTLVGELLGVRARGQLGGLLFSIAYVFMFALVKSFPYALDAIPLRFIFAAMAVVNVVMVAFVVKWLPETLGKSFGEIERLFVVEEERSRTEGA